MQTRKFDELISYFNRNVSNMDIDQKYKIELLGMITAIGFAHEKELHDPTIEPERKKGHWIKGKMWSEGIGMGETYGFYYACSECNFSVQGGYDVCGKNFCEKCGADNRGDGEKDA